MKKQLAGGGPGVDALVEALELDAFVLHSLDGFDEVRAFDLIYSKQFLHRLNLTAGHLPFEYALTPKTTGGFQSGAGPL